jgi:uncharacterized short protein YbdD (DUF466 family)
MPECLRALLRRLVEAGRLMVGQPDYDRYVEQQRRLNPDGKVMSREEFFWNRQQRRYGGGKCGCG